MTGRPFQVLSFLVVGSWTVCPVRFGKPLSFFSMIREKPDSLVAAGVGVCWVLGAGAAGEENGAG